jgi:hypothetical protein
VNADENVCDEPRYCMYKGIFCDHVLDCKYGGKCTLYEVEARGNGIIAYRICRGDDDLLDFIKRMFKDEQTEVKVKKGRI